MTGTREVQRLRARLAAAAEICEVAGRREQLESVLAELDGGKPQQALGPVERVEARAMQGTACEIEAQGRAINLQETSAIMFDRVHQTGKSRNARQRADHARERLWQALAEQDKAGKG